MSASIPVVAPTSVASSPAVDQPAYDKDRSFTGHIFYVDAATGKKYWVDARGDRHYEF